MKKLIFIILIISCKNKENSLVNNRIKFIDSLTTLMDSLVFKNKDAGIENSVIEHFDGYGYFFNKKQPQFLKYSYHGHDKTFKDSGFYYYNKSLVKIVVTEETDQHKTINSQSYYFDNDKLLNNEVAKDSTQIKQLNVLAETHLSKLIDVHKLKN